MEKKEGLTILAEFDDLSRYNNATFSGSALHFDKFIQVLNKTEEFRQNLQESDKLLKKKDLDLKKLKEQNQELEQRLAATRKAFTREACAKEAALKDYNFLKQKLKLVQSLLNDANSHNQTKQVYNVLSSINLNGEHLSRVNLGVGLPSTFNEPDEGEELLFDKSDDNLEPDMAEIETTKINTNPKSLAERMDIAFMDGKDVNMNNTFDKLPSFPARNFATSKMVTCGNLQSKQIMDKVDTLGSCLLIPGTSKPQPGLKRSDSQYNYLNKIFKKTMSSGKSFKLEPERLTTKSHEFVEKICYTSMKCVPCGKNIGFCNKYLICNECRGVTHVQLPCPGNLPRPCCPKSTCSSVGLKKMITGENVPETIKIGDFTDSNVRPWVPGLLIHCCNEIDRRIEAALKNPSSNSIDLRGLYQNRAPESDVRDLKKKILEARNGIPILANESVTVLCEVVKSFLRTLDDPIVTKILFNDFVRAAQNVEDEMKQLATSSDGQSDYSSDNELVDHLDSIIMLKSVVLHLPLPNRDSLAFFFLHLKRVIQAKIVTKVDAEELAVVFAPILARGTTSTTFNHDSHKNVQLVIVEALFKITTSFWTGLINDPHFNPFKETLKEPLNKRKSVGGKTMIGHNDDTTFETDTDNKGDSFY